MGSPSSRKALGRGLAALIPNAPESGSAEATSNAGPGLRVLPIERIHPCPTQPRKSFDADALDELAASIREQGILQPLVVRRKGDGYEIVAGERRWRAAALAGVQEVPAVVKEFSDAEALQAALVENIQRANLDPLEEAETYRRLMRDYSLSQENVARAVGKSRSAVANSIRLLKLPEKILEFLADGRLTAGHARALMTLNDDEDMVTLAQDAMRRKLSVRDTEAKARMMKRSAEKAAKVLTTQPTPAERNVTEKLSKALKTKVRLHHRKGKGRIELFFHSFDELDALIERMTRLS